MVSIRLSILSIFWVYTHIGKDRHLPHLLGEEIRKTISEVCYDNKQQSLSFYWMNDLLFWWYCGYIAGDCRRCKRPPWGLQNRANSCNDQKQKHINAINFISDCSLQRFWHFYFGSLSIHSRTKVSIMQYSYVSFKKEKLV